MGGFPVPGLRFFVGMGPMPAIVVLGVLTVPCSRYHTTYAQQYVAEPPGGRWSRREWLQNEQVRAGANYLKLHS